MNNKKKFVFENRGDSYIPFLKEYPEDWDGNTLVICREHKTEHLTYDGAGAASMIPEVEMRIELYTNNALLRKYFGAGQWEAFMSWVKVDRERRAEFMKTEVKNG